MSRAYGIVVVLAALAVGCSSSSSSGGSSGDGPCSGAACAAPTQCPEGLAPDAAAGACLDVSPTEDCPPGTGAFLGSTTCQPIGWTVCAAPFEKDPSGWGCRPILAASCPANTLAVLGSTECRPIGDCAAPFPPANATIFVDASLTTTDATHYTSLFDAVQNANPGAVIAVAKGTYVEDVDVMRSNITIVGKCAAEVTIKNPGDRRAGILVTAGARGVKVSGLTLTGHYSGMLVKAGGEATLTDSVIVKNRWQGVYVAEASSSLRVLRTHIDDVVVDEQGKFGWGAAAQLGGAIELEDVLIESSTASGVVVGGPKSTGKLTRVVVHSPRVDAAGFASAVDAVDSGSVQIDGGAFDHMTTVGVMVSGGTMKARHMMVVGTDAGTSKAGRGLQVSMGGQLDLAESSIAESADSNIVVVGQGSSATIAETLVRGVLGGDGTRGDHGITVAGGAALTLSGSALVSNIEVGLAIQDPDTHVTADRVLVTETRPRLDPKLGELLGIGVGVAWGGTLTMTHGAIVKNRGTGFLVSDPDESGAIPHADIASTLVLRTEPNANVAVGRSLQVSTGGTASLDGCALVESTEIAALVGAAGSRLDIKNSVVRDTRLIDGRFGDGVIVDSEGTLTVDRSWLLGHPGIAVAVIGGRATLSRSLVARSAVAIHVQGGSKLETVDQVPAEPDALSCIVSNDTRFVENQTRIGSGEVPLPSPLGDVPRKPSKLP